MIRFTFTDGTVGTVENYEREIIQQQYRVNKIKIKKVEKQIKDLTLEECRNLGIYIVELRSDGYWTVNEITHEYRPYYDDTYIDITHLIKGE